MKINDLLGCSLEQNVNTFKKDLQDSLKEIFRGRIKPGFLIKMESFLREMLFAANPKLFMGDIPFSLDGEVKTKRLLTGFSYTNSMYPEIYSYCRLIVAFHSSRFAFETDEVRRKSEKAEEYQRDLALDVFEAFYLKQYVYGSFERNKLYNGEEFAFYPVPFWCAVMTGRMVQILQNGVNDVNPFGMIYDNLICKSMSVQSLLQDGHFDGAYTIERSMIEIFMKLYVLRLFPECLDEYYKFVKYEYDHACGNDSLYSHLDQEFECRKFRNENNRTGFMHYGWVESLPDYTKYTDRYPYTFRSLVNYITSVCPDEDAGMLEKLSSFYGLCHGYTHGEVTRIDIAFLHYMEISYVLALIVPNLYNWICKEYNKDVVISVDVRGDGKVISAANILEKFQKHFDILKAQYDGRSPELFDLYSKHEW